MIVEKLSISSANLNTGTDQELAISKISVDDDTGLVDHKKHYRVTSIRIENNTGDAIYAIFFNDLEKVEYDVPNALFQDKFKMANGNSEIFEINRTVTNIVISGTSGVGHSIPLDIYVVKE